MATTFCGSVSLAQTFPGFVAVLSPLRGGLASLRAAAAVALAAVADVRAQVEVGANLVASVEGDLDTALVAHLDALGAFRLAIRAKALADLEVQLAGAVALEASFKASLSDPAAYVGGLIAAVGAVEFNLTALIPQPQIALGAQLSASAALAFELKAKIEAFDAVLAQLGQISAALTVALGAVLGVLAELKALLQAAAAAMVALSAALQVAIDATTAPLDAALALEADLTLGSAEVYRYDGALSGMGASVDASIAANSGIAGAAGVRLWVVVAPDANAALQGKLNVLLKTNP